MNWEQLNQIIENKFADRSKNLSFPTTLLEKFETLKVWSSYQITWSLVQVKSKIKTQKTGNKKIRIRDKNGGIEIEEKRKKKKEI